MSAADDETPARRGSLTGRQYLGASRVRGAAPWRPRAATLALLIEVEAVLDAYRFPITLRQVFYRLVGLGHLVKTEQAYARLQEHLNRARRSGRIAWERIADDTLVSYGPMIHADRGAWIGWARGEVTDPMRHVLRDWRQGQPEDVLLWVESMGMAASLRTAIGGLGWPVPVLSTSGTDSARPKRDTARLAVERYRAIGQPTVIGHLSDLDEHGLGLADAFAEDVTAHADDLGEPDAVRVERVTLTAEQVVRHNLPTNPGKAAFLDRTGRMHVPPGGTMAESVQAEALDPNDLLTIVHRWLVDHVDLDRLNDALADAAVTSEGLDFNLGELL